MAKKDETVVPALLEKMRVDNERATADAAAARQKALEESRKALKEAQRRAEIPVFKGAEEALKGAVEALRRLEEDNDLLVKTAEQQAKLEEARSKSSAGQALALKAELEAQGKTLSKSGKFTKLSFKARRDAKKKELKSAETPAQRKQIKEDMRADAKKNGNLLQKMVAGIGGLWEMGKKRLKQIGKGAMAFLSTLALGGLLIALGKFLQSDTFKTLSKYIEETLWPILQSFGETIMEFFQGPQFAAMMEYITGTLIPKLKGFYDAFFGPEGSFANGFSALFSDDSGIGTIVLGIMGVVALLGVLKLRKIFGPLGTAIGLLLGGFKALTKLVKGKTPKIPKTPTPGTAGTPLKTTGVPKPGDVITSKAGNKVLAGADGKATSIKAGDKAGKAKIMAAAAKSAKGAGAAGGAVSKVGKGFAHLKKYPLLLKAAKKIPLLGPILSTVGVISLLTGNASKEDKIKGIGGLLGGGLGSFGFGVVGAALGSIFPGPGNVIGGLLGSLVGWFGGEWAGEKLAGFLMGEELSEKELLQNQKAPTSNGAKKQQVVANISKNVGDVMADRRIAGGAYKPGRGQDMGEDFEEPSTQMANFQRAKIKRAADTNSNEGSPAINVNAPSNKNITNNGGMNGGGGSLRSSKFGNLNQRYVRDEGL
jgi:hypothetical protein